MTRRRNLVVSALIGAGLVVAAVIAPSLSDAAPAPTTAHGGDIQFKAALDNSFCLSIDESGGQPAAILAQCSAAVSQRFTLSNGADGRNVLLDFQGRCLSRGAKLSKNFYAIGVAPCTYQTKERWRFLITGELSQASPNVCTVVPRAAANVAVNLVPCENVDSQRWKLSQ